MFSPALIRLRAQLRPRRVRKREPELPDLPDSPGAVHSGGTATGKQRLQGNANAVPTRLALGNLTPANPVWVEDVRGVLPAQRGTSVSWSHQDDKMG
jgi:hypothetical protein